MARVGVAVVQIFSSLDTHRSKYFVVFLSFRPYKPVHFLSLVSNAQQEHG